MERGKKNQFYVVENAILFVIIIGKPTYQDTL